MSEQVWPDPSKSQFSTLASRYQLGKLLGAGRFGQVFEAQDVKYDPPRPVAIKVVHSRLLSQPEALNELRHEAGIMSRLDHPGILRVLDYEVTPQQAYIVTELATGGSLADKIQPNFENAPKGLPLADVARYLKSIADALDAIHAAGIVYGDIKPSNILLDADDRPLLTDFGSAVVLNGYISSQVADYVDIAPLYAAPEVWNGTVSKSSDIYALGVTLYELLTGHPPFTGNRHNFTLQHAVAPMPDLNAKTVKYIPPELNELMQQTLAKNPADRPKTAGELYQQFQAVVDGRPPAHLTLGSTAPIPLSLYDSIQLWLKNPLGALGLGVLAVTLAVFLFIAFQLVFWVFLVLGIFCLWLIDNSKTP